MHGPLNVKHSKVYASHTNACTLHIDIPNKLLRVNFVMFPAGVIGILHWHKILPIALWSWDRFNLQEKWVPGAFPEGKGGRCIRLTTYHHPVPLSRNLGTLIPWNLLGHSRPVKGLLYLYQISLCTSYSLPARSGSKCWQHIFKVATCMIAAGRKRDFGLNVLQFLQ